MKRANGLSFHNVMALREKNVEIVTRVKQFSQLIKDLSIKSGTEQEALVRFKSGTKPRGSPSAIEQWVTNLGKRDGIESTSTKPTEAKP